MLIAERIEGLGRDDRLYRDRFAPKLPLPWEAPPPILPRVPRRTPDVKSYTLQ